MQCRLAHQIRVQFMCKLEVQLRRQTPASFQDELRECDKAHNLSSLLLLLRSLTLPFKSSIQAFFGTHLSLPLLEIEET